MGTNQKSKVKIENGELRNGNRIMEFSPPSAGWRSGLEFRTKIFEFHRGRTSLKTGSQRGSTSKNETHENRIWNLGKT